MLHVQEVQGLWEEVHEELKQKKIRMKELNVKLTQCESETAEQVRCRLYYVPQGPLFYSYILYIIHQKVVPCLKSYSDQGLKNL